MSRFKAFTKGIYQSDNIKVPKQEKNWKGKEIGAHFATSKIGSLQEIIRSSFFNIPSMQY
jgi:hypothetical protein